jgi:kanamycin kinase
MKLHQIKIDFAEYPEELHGLLDCARVYDSSCSAEARVIFVDKDSGYFIKKAAKGSLKREAEMTRYFYKLGLSANVAQYLSKEYDFLVTEKIKGDNCINAKYSEQPDRLCDTIAELLALLHSREFANCPVPDHTQDYIAIAEQNYKTGNYNKCASPDSFGYKSVDEAWRVVKSKSHLLKTDTLLHGDYCLPNIILNDWSFSGFVDVGNGGIGDKHIDIFWAIWSLRHNLKTERYRKRFIDAYGREKIDEEMLYTVAAFEVFG